MVELTIFITCLIVNIDLLIGLLNWSSFWASLFLPLFVSSYEPKKNENPLTRKWKWIFLAFRSGLRVWAARLVPSTKYSLDSFMESSQMCFYRPTANWNKCFRYNTTEIVTYDISLNIIDPHRMPTTDIRSNSNENRPLRRILLVDDEVDVISVFKMILEMNGY